MSLVVSDSGPIHYLILCGAIDAIPKVYGQLVIPVAVAAELSHPHTPPEIQAWVKLLPAWASIKSAQQIDSIAQLGLGEREAIALACELNAAQLLVDDRTARCVALGRGLLITGTIGFLEQAASDGLLSLPDVLRKLLLTNFRIDPEVVRNALKRDADRQNQHKK